MKWLVKYIGGNFDSLSAPNKASARKHAEERAHQLRLAGVENVEPYDEENTPRGVTYVVMDPWGSRVVFKNGLSRCVDYVMKNSGGWIGAIHARSRTGKLRNLTPVEEDKAIKLSKR